MVGIEIVVIAAFSFVLGACFAWACDDVYDTVNDSEVEEREGYQ